MYEKIRALLILLLIALGLIQSIGGLQGSLLMEVGYASAASPFPDVFGSVADLEPMSQHYYLDFQNEQNQIQRVELDRGLSRKFEADTGYIVRYTPYLFAIVWYPLLKKEFLDQILGHAFCDPAPLKKLLGVKDRVESVRLSLKSRTELKSKYEREGKEYLLTCPE